MDRATLKRYCKRLDESTAPWRTGEGSRKAPKLDERARKLLVKDLQEETVGHLLSQRIEFLVTVVGMVKVSEATICRAVKRHTHSRNKDPEGQQKETSS